MSAIYFYDKIIKYLITVTCTEPFHIGSADGDEGEILVHPVDGQPFVQASGIAGIFRDYYTRANTEEQAEKLFGACRQDDDDKESGYGSRVRFTDGTFLTGKTGVKIELRPRVAIDPVSGTSSTGSIKGTDRQAGHKFETEYIGTGAKFTFCVYLYDEAFQESLEDVFAAVNSGTLQFGGKKSCGCGSVSIDSLKRKTFDMTREEDRRLWNREDSLKEEDYEDCQAALKTGSRIKDAYDICVTGRTKGTLLVKSAVVTDYGKDAPDSMNMRNAKNDYVIPGSSLKGAVRNQMEKIADYLKQKGAHTEDVITEAFGSSGDQGSDGISGNLRFYDAIVGEKDAEAREELAHRIHIDKFTGGVMYGSLFTEKNIAGQVSIRISVLDKNDPDRTMGILIMALRDLAIGAMNLGSGYSVGKGFIDVDQISITCNRAGTAKADVDVHGGVVHDPDGIIRRCLELAAGRRD